MRHSEARRSRQQGFVLLSAIFVLMLCSVLSVILIRSSEHASSMKEVSYLSTQAQLLSVSAMNLLSKENFRCMASERRALKLDSINRHGCDIFIECGEEERVSSVLTRCPVDESTVVTRRAKKP